MPKEFAVITDTDSLAIFKTLGVDYHLIQNGTERNVFEKIYNQKYKIIFVTESVYEKCKELIDREKTFPIVTILPSLIYRNQLGRLNLVKLIRTATGTYFSFSEQKGANAKELIRTMGDSSLHSE